jgi:hypothetical protein
MEGTGGIAYVSMEYFAFMSSGPCRQRGVTQMPRPRAFKGGHWRHRLCVHGLFCIHEQRSVPPTGCHSNAAASCLQRRALEASLMCQLCVFAAVDPMCLEHARNMQKSSHRLPSFNRVVNRSPGPPLTRESYREGWPRQRFTLEGYGEARPG